MRRHAGISQLLRRVALTDEARTRGYFLRFCDRCQKPHPLDRLRRKLPMGGRVRSWQAKKP